MSVCGARDRAQGVSLVPYRLRTLRAQQYIQTGKKPAGPLSPILVNVWLEGKGELGE